MEFCRVKKIALNHVAKMYIQILTFMKSYRFLKGFGNTRALMSLKKI